MLPSEQELSTLLDILYEAAADPALWRSFLERAAKPSRATSAAFVMHDVQRASCTVASSWQLDPACDRLYQRRYHALDVWAQRASSAARHVCTSESLCSRAELKTKEIYNDFFLGAGIEQAIFALLENSESRIASLSLYRDKSRPEFIESDLFILRFLIPHLRRAFKLHLSFSELKSRAVGVESALDMLPIGLVFVGTRGEIIFMNRSASAVIAERDGLLASSSGLRAERTTESNLLTRAVQQVASTSSGHGLSAGGTILIWRRSRPPLQVVISPIRNPQIEASKPIAAVAFIHDPSRYQRPTDELLATVYGLTPAERRVALLLSDGKAPLEIANIVGVTVHTIRSQIKTIHYKTGAKKQSELMRLLLSHSDPTSNR